MPLPLYLAMTAAEISKKSVLPAHLAYMACHFSPYGTGLSNLPGSLPTGSMLILNDRIPVHGQDPDRISDQLITVIFQNKVSSVLLDLERPPNRESTEIVRKLCNTLPCPVGVAAGYAVDLDTPVFIGAAAYETPEESWNAFQGREIWLEANLERTIVKVTQSGAQVLADPDTSDPLPYFSEVLSSHYRIALYEDHVYFHFGRTKDDIIHLLERSNKITCAIGLWQQFKI